MRSSLSCDACRRSKIKCVNSGSPPCQRCEKSGIADCALSRPRPLASRPASNGGSIDGRSRKRSSSAAASPRKNDVLRQLDSPPVPRSVSAAATPRPAPVCKESVADVPGETPPFVAPMDIDAHLVGLPEGVVLKALNVFINSYPELAVLHLPTLVQDLRTTRSFEGRALLGAVLAVTKAQLAVLSASWAGTLLSREEYAGYAKNALAGFIFQPPKVQVVQALLIITLHEWGSRDFHKAWMYCGIAIRIMQAIHSSRVAPHRLDSATANHDGNDAVTLAIETRAYWSCFIMDCMVNSGTYNPPMLPMSEMQKLKVARPLGVVDFAFPPENVPPFISADQCPLAGEANGPLDFTRSFEILVGGFDIWTQVMTFIFNDGRRAPGMCAPPNCPWVAGSPWSESRNRLEMWRIGQHRKLHYPSNSVAIHMTLGFGETFVYLNLLYYTSTLMLHREYFPFLPTPDAGPCGPTDHPPLEAPAPPGWWEESARLLFSAAEQIARILHDASECGVHLMTPFAGFCAFSAAYVNLYVFRYPLMNLGRSPGAEHCLQLCLDYLHQFRHVWSIADGWIKTIHQASLLYERATKDAARYRGRSRRDFDTLHQSVHEFRVVDRSDDHTRELDGAEHALVPCSLETVQEVSENAHEMDSSRDDTNSLLNQLLTEVSNNVDEQGVWSQWWPQFPMAPPSAP
ncbi:hypothetical protein HIM_07407 [Hirsutella minnesotensis 3608]|uniref:Zn(2)-C6 fungal-type domain-containing protein n=1 Tax=Hirsutella minnesotensis 3608 TaxID=1043627 RepID=A0A0F7ZN65_9HYPO|nr:hypothetical protein HIM_07407 [Hirsutella minnesotensis 3608]